MELEFYKYQGTGNDFIMIDSRDQSFNEADLSLISRLCDRRFGIGADGLILLKQKKGYHFEMVYYNADGSQSMCGNGARCSVAFARFLGLLRDQCRFYTIDGAHEAQYYQGEVQLGMIPVQKISKVGLDFFVNTGSPHHVRFVDDVDSYPILEEGPLVGYGDRYAEGSNVNFVSTISDGEIFVRTYERGVENETLSCGTGVTACALVAGSLTGKDRISIKTLGGSLTVSFTAKSDGSFHDILLIGPAEQVFYGNIDL